MTNETELRDRIKRIVHEKNAYYGGHSGRANPATIAQAIIDDLALTVEETNAVTKRTDENGNTWCDVNSRRMMTRIVGKWETK